MSRRQALGIAGTAGAGLAGLGALLLGRRFPRAKPVAGTVRRVEAYGDDPAQQGEWWLPPGEDGRTGRLPTVVLVHGGYWRPGYDRSLEDAVAADLSGRGLLVWNVDYRAGNVPWPATLLDVAAAHDHLGSGPLAARVDLARTAVVGHSAGGHLALWLAARHRLPAGAPGAAPTAPRPALVLAQAPVAALRQAAVEGLGGGAAAALVDGGPAQVPERYRVADPVALVPTGVPTVLLHSATDEAVPLSQSTAYVAAAVAAGDDARLVQVPGDHFAHLKPTSPAVQELRRLLAGL